MYAENNNLVLEPGKFELWQPKIRFPTPDDDPLLFLGTMVCAPRHERFTEQKGGSLLHYSVRDAFQIAHDQVPTLPIMNSNAIVHDWSAFEATVAACACVATFPDQEQELEHGKHATRFLRDFAYALTNQLSKALASPAGSAHSLPEDFDTTRLPQAVRDFLEFTEIPVCFPPNCNVPEWAHSLGFFGKLERSHNSEGVDAKIRANNRKASATAASSATTTTTTTGGTKAGATAATSAAAAAAAAAAGAGAAASAAAASAAYGDSNDDCTVVAIEAKLRMGSVSLETFLKVATRATGPIDRSPPAPVFCLAATGFNSNTLGGISLSSLPGGAAAGAPSTIHSASDSATAPLLSSTPAAAAAAAATAAAATTHSPATQSVIND